MYKLTLRVVAEVGAQHRHRDPYVLRPSGLSHPPAQVGVLRPPGADVAVPIVVWALQHNRKELLLAKLLSTPTSDSALRGAQPCVEALTYVAHILDDDRVPLRRRLPLRGQIQRVVDLSMLESRGDHTDTLPRRGRRAGLHRRSHQVRCNFDYKQSIRHLQKSGCGGGDCLCILTAVQVRAAERAVQRDAFRSRAARVGLGCWWRYRLRPRQEPTIAWWSRRIRIR